MIAKVVAWGEDRDQARRRLRRALTETAVKGITTNTKFLRDLLDDEAFVSGDYHTGSVTQILEREEEKLSDELTDVATVAAAIKTFRRDRKQAEARAANASPTGDGGSWRGGSWRRGGL